MAEKLSTKLCNAILNNAFPGGTLTAVWTTPELRFYSGAVPATADAAAGTQIVVVKEAGGALSFATPVGGVTTKSSTAWTGTVATGGTATYYRMVNTGDADANDTGATLPRIQGTVGTIGADMNLLSTTIAAGTFTVNYYQQAIVPS